MIEKQNGPESGPWSPDPIFIAGGAGVYTGRSFAKASLLQNGNGNDLIGSSGVQSFFPNDEENIYCAGAGFIEGPDVSQLAEDSVPPESYAQGLKGGKGKDYYG